MSTNCKLQIAPAWVHFSMSLSYWGQNQPDLIRCNNSFEKWNLKLLVYICNTASVCFISYQGIPVRSRRSARSRSPTNIKTSDFIKNSSQQGEEVKPGQEVSKVKKSHQPEDVSQTSRTPYIWVKKSQQGQEVPPYLKCHISYDWRRRSLSLLGTSRP